MSNSLELEELEMIPSCSHCAAEFEVQEEVDKLVYCRSTANADHYYCPYCKSEGIDIDNRTEEDMGDLNFSDTFNKPYSENLSAFGTKDNPLMVSLSKKLKRQMGEEGFNNSMLKLIKHMHEENITKGPYHVLFVNMD